MTLTVKRVRPFAGTVIFSGPVTFVPSNLPRQETGRVSACAEWFVSLDTEAILAAGVGRNADGTVSLNGFLSLTDAAPADVGARLD